MTNKFLLRYPQTHMNLITPIQINLIPLFFTKYLLLGDGWSDSLVNHLLVSKIFKGCIILAPQAKISKYLPSVSHIHMLQMVPSLCLTQISRFIF